KPWAHNSPPVRSLGDWTPGPAAHPRRPRLGPSLAAPHHRASPILLASPNVLLRPPRPRNVHNVHRAFQLPPRPPNDPPVDCPAQQEEKQGAAADANSNLGALGKGGLAD